VHLQSIYAHLEERKVPNVDSLVYQYDTTFVLSPRGITKPPKTEKELLDAIISVLEALEVSGR
jgi:hypothetical protein